MGEYITEETVVIFTLKSKSKNLIVELYDPKGKVIYSKKNKLEIKVSLTASESGNYEMCVKNNDKKIVQIDYEILTGIQAQDYSQFAKESSIQPAEAAIVKLKNMGKSLIKDFNKVVKAEDKNQKVNDVIIGKISMVSMITILVMITVGSSNFVILENIYKKENLFKIIFSNYLI